MHIHFWKPSQLLRAIEGMSLEKEPTTMTLLTQDNP